jgi:hypothetical protein
MFTPWIKRKSLKRTSRGKTLLVNGESPSRIILLSVSVLCVMVGLYIVQHAVADSVPPGDYTPAPTVSGSPSVLPTP